MCSCGSLHVYVQGSKRIRIYRGFIQVRLSFRILQTSICLSSSVSKAIVRLFFPVVEVILINQFLQTIEFTYLCFRNFLFSLFLLFLGLLLYFLFFLRHYCLCLSGLQRRRRLHFSRFNNWFLFLLYYSWFLFCLFYLRSRHGSSFRLLNYTT